MTRRQQLSLAVSAARAAGDRLRSAWNRRHRVLPSSARDVKLAADAQSEAAVLGVLLSETDHPVLAEESGRHGASEADGPMWIVDPLDGTLNYSRGIGLCCVSVGLWEGDRPVLGVVHDFSRDQTFSGIVGQGAWLNGNSVSVSDARMPAEAVLATGFPVNRNFDSGPLQEFVRRIQEYKKLRLLGSAALSLAYVAAGQVDAYSEEDIMLWDVAAGVALVLAAGGKAEVLPSSGHAWARTVRCAATAELLGRSS